MEEYKTRKFVDLHKALEKLLGAVLVADGDHGVIETDFDNGLSVHLTVDIKDIGE